MTAVLAPEVRTLVIEGLPDWIEEQPELRRRLREIMREPLGQPPQKMTYEEFLAWADEDTLAEWVDGEVRMYSPASKRHQDLGGFLYEVLRAYVRPCGLGEVIQAPFQMKLKHGREPDVLFVAEAHLERLKETYLEGPADLVVEIVSPESVGRDRGEKFYEYEQAGVYEYWLMDPLREQAEFYQLGPQDRYQTVMPEAGGIYRSVALPDFWLRVEWLWQDPLPSPIRTLAEIVGMDASVVEAFERALAGPLSPKKEG